MEILAAFDLLGSFHAAADLAGCSHHTVARLVAERDAGGAAPRTSRPRLVDEFLPKIEEWVDQSNSKIRADVAHDKLVAMGLAFLALGDGAALWLKEAAAQGSSRIRVKMAHAVSIAKLTNPARVDWALGHAAVHQRFGEGDLASILAANLDPGTPAARQAGEDKSLTQGTAGWAALGAAPTDSLVDSHRHNNSHEYPEHDGHNNSHPVEDNR